MDFTSRPIVPPDPAGTCFDPDLIGQVIAGFGVAVLAESDIPAGRDLAASLLGRDAIASAAEFIAIQRLTACMIWGYWEERALTGVLASIPLTARGVQAVEAGTFDPAIIDHGLVQAPPVTPAAFYSWGIAARTKAASRALVKASLAAHETLLWAVPAYGRATTPSGRRLVASLGYAPTDPRASAVLKKDAPGRARGARP